MATIVTPPASIKVQIGNQQGSSVSIAGSAVDIIAREAAAAASSQANSAYILANTSYTIAISAYEKANTDASDALAYAIALG